MGEGDLNTLEVKSGSQGALGMPSKSASVLSVHFLPFML